MEEKNSLLVWRTGGAMEQILADEHALYVVGLRPGFRHAIDDLSQFAPGPDRRRIPKDEIGLVHILRGDAQTQISMNTADGERTWRMDVRIPDEAVRMIFGGLDLLCEDQDALLDVDRMYVPPIPASELLVEIGMGALAVLLPALLWIRQSPILFWLSMAYFPSALTLLARCGGTRLGRLGAKRLLWLLPGVGLTLLHARVNLPNPRQIILPAMLIALLSGLAWLLLCRGKGRLRRMAVVLIACLLTYAPGAALSVNGLGGDRLRTIRVTPRMVRTDWIEAPLDGRLQRFYVNPAVCRKLSVNAPCELMLYRGAMGIEYWAAAPQEGPNEV